MNPYNIIVAIVREAPFSRPERASVIIQLCSILWRLQTAVIFRKRNSVGRFDQDQSVTEKIQV